MALSGGKLFPVALRTLVAGMEQGVCDGNMIGTGKRRGAVAPVTVRTRLAGIGLIHGCRILRENGLGLLRTSSPHQFLCHGMERGFQLLTLRFAQRRTRAAIDDLIQFLQIHIDPLSHGDHWLRYSRKRRVKGKPRTSLIGRFGLFVWSFLPRPVVSPSSCQLAAR